MHLILFRLGLRPRTRWGSSQRSPRLPSWTLRVLLLRAGRGGKGEGKGRWKGKEGGAGREGKEGEGKTLWICSPPRKKIPSYATD